jgi:hypothetical protein
MAAGYVDEELAEAASGMVGRLHGHNPSPVATQNDRVVPERPNARRLLLRLPEIIRVVFHWGMTAARSAFNEQVSEITLLLSAVAIVRMSSPSRSRRGR